MALEKQQGLFDGHDHRTYSNIVWADACADPLGVAPERVKVMQYRKWLNERYGKFAGDIKEPSSDDIGE